MKDEILGLLAETDGFLSGQEISQKLGVSRQAIWKTINSLKNSGYEIESVTNKGYRLISLPEYINFWSVKRGLKTNYIGKNILYLDSVGSTNDYLKRLGDSGCASGTVAVAREQTKGKGRLGRVWESEKDVGITFSVLLRPDIQPNEVAPITPLVGLAVCRAIREYTKLDCKIKWPNDIIAGQKKLVGILTEVSAEFDAVEYVLTGIGINFDNQKFPEAIAHKATSVFLETGRHFDKNELFVRILWHIENVLEETGYKFTPSVLEEYTRLCATVGREVSFIRSGEKTTGTAVGIDGRGELKISLPDGEICIVNSGEVTVQGIY